MKRDGLHIAADFALPLEAITETFSLLAKRGAGKTYTAMVMVEEMLAHAMPVVVVDPVGVWWGLRTSADGKSAGLPITILGGDHGDLPLEPAAGGVIADLVVEEHLPMILDLSLLRKGEQDKFVTDFAERLFHRSRDPLHLVHDVADAWAPQRPMKGQERMLGAVEDLVRRGRAHGLGVTLVTQRAAVLNKNVLTQTEVLIALRTIPAANAAGATCSASARFSVSSTWSSTGAASARRSGCVPKRFANERGSNSVATSSCAFDIALDGTAGWR